MTDKVQKIREEVERLKVWNNNVRNSTRHMTLQEEDFNRGKHSSYLEILNFIDSLQEEPVSEDLIVATNNYCVNVRKGYPRVMDETDRYICNAFKAGAKWKEQQIMSNAIDAHVNYAWSGLSLGDFDWSKTELDLGDRCKLIIIKQE